MSRVLMATPDILLLDEPSMGLASVLVDSVFDTIKELHKQGVTILLVEQNARIPLKTANCGYVIQTVEVILEDDAAKLLDNEMVKKSYMGD